MKDEKIIELGSSSMKISALERRVRRVLDIEPSARLRAIIDDSDAKALVRAMPPQELLITIKQVGEPDAAELVEMASGEQVRFFTDVEWWIGDALDTKRILKWIDLFIECGEEKVIEWLRVVDAELLVTILRKFILVTKPDEGTKPEKLADTAAPYTIDNIYHLHFFSDDAQRIWSRVLVLFASRRYDLYKRLMEGLVWEAGPETEELAIRWRNGRLRDVGIPDIDEAIEVYRRLDERTFSTLPPKEAPLKFGDDEVPIRYPLAVAEGERLLLSDALSRIDDPEAIDGIAQELAHLVNRVMVADHEDLADADAIMNAAVKVRATVSMGLEALASGDADRAAQLARERWLLNIFQVGYSRALDIARRAYGMTRRGWIADAPDAVELLGEPLAQIFDGVKRQRPMWFVGGSEPYRSFLSLGEVAEASKALDKIEYLGELFFHRLKLLEADPSSWRHKRVHPVDVTFVTVLRTAFANAAVGRGLIFKPLAKSDLKTLLEKAFDEKPATDGKRKIIDTARADMIAYLEGQGAATNDIEREIRDEFVEHCMNSLESELGRIGPTESIDPKFIQGLLIKDEV